MLKKLLAILLACMMLLPCAPVLAEEPLTCGEYSYSLNDDGSATILTCKSGDEVLTVPEELDGRPVTAIGDRAFILCYFLRKITLPEGVASIGELAFANCQSLKDVILPDGLVSIGSEAFNNCTSLSVISLPDSVTDVGSNPFTNCPKLTKITVSPDHPALEIIDGALFDRADRRLICYPCAFTDKSYAVPQGTRAISGNAFAFCASLTCVSLPDSVTDVGPNPFPHCPNLREIAVSPDHPALEIIDGALFDRADRRLICYPCAFTDKSYAVPQGTRAIGEAAFRGCDALTRITLPESLTSIGREAFSFCTSLSDIALPDGLRSVGDAAFSSCFFLTSAAIPESVSSIGGDAFDSCPSLTLTVPQGSYAETYAVENNIPYTF